MYLKSLFCCVLVFLFSFVSAIPPSGQALSLKSELQLAVPGDYIVYLQNRLYTLFLVSGKNESTIQIQEITVPENQIKFSKKSGSSQKFSWRSLIQNANPKKYSWAVYEISLSTGKIISYYSATNQQWLDAAKTQNFLPTLLNLRFSFIPYEKRKKVGPPPLSGEQEKRKPWQPPLTIDGKTIKKAAFTAWMTSWPKDQSVLAGRVIYIYQAENNPDAIAYFPYWIEVPDSPGEDKIHAVDSGKGLQSPVSMPAH